MSKSVLVIGVNGYVGTVVAEAFAKSGYQVSALRRPGGTEVPAAYAAISGDLVDPPTLTNAATGFDLVLHIGLNFGGDRDLAIADALVASGTPVLYTSSADVLPPGFATEDTVPDPHPIVRGRDEVERRFRAAGGWALRLGMVYGGGPRGGVVEKMLEPLAVRVGAGVYLGPPTTRWGTVHIDDLAALYLLVAERAPAGTVWHGVSQTVPLHELVAAAAGGTAISWPADEEPPPEIGPLAGIFTYDQDVSSEQTQRLLGWHPVHTTVLEDLAKAHAART